MFVNFLTALNIDFCLLLANCQFSSGKFSRNKASKNIEQLQIDEHKNVKIIFVYLFECLFAQQIKKISLVTRKKCHSTTGSKSFMNLYLYPKTWIFSTYQTTLALLLNPVNVIMLNQNVLFYNK